MKLTISDLAKCAKTTGRKKFLKMSSKKQHELLAALAYNFIGSGSLSDFLQRYDELHSWTNLDRYHPPSWLSKEEAFKEFAAFHNSFSLRPIGIEKDGSEIPVSWEPVFNVTVVIDQVRSPYNVGSILRIIDNFGFKELIHSTSTLNLDHPQLKKSARKCEKWIPVRYEKNLLSWLAEVEIPIIGIEKAKSAIPVHAWTPPETCILISGNETYGISEAIRKCCMETVQIPMFGFKKSMNVHQALSIVAQRFVEKNR